jgi:hypothetical protein
MIASTSGDGIYRLAIAEAPRPRAIVMMKT